MENEFNFRGIKKYEPTDVGLNTDFKSPGYFGGENRRSVTSEQGQTDGGIEFAFNTGWENSRRNFYKNRERVKENLNHSQVSRHKKAQFFRGSGYLVCSQYKASASLGVSILSVPCGLFVL